MPTKKILKKKHAQKLPLILVAEDDVYYARVCSLKFAKEGYDVQTAGNGEQALTLMRARKPDLVLLDLIMPVKDGFTTLEEMKADPDLRSIPVIVVTNLGQESDRKKALDLGAKEYVVKSNVSIYELVDIVKKYLPPS